MVSGRTEYTENLVKDLRLNLIMEEVPTKVAPMIQPTYELRPNIVEFATSSVSALSEAILATGDRDFYLVGAQLSFVKDVTATATIFTVSAVTNGALRRVLNLQSTTTTIENGECNITLPMPGMLIDRNTSIVLTADTNVANFVSRGTVFGYFLAK